MHENIELNDENLDESLQNNNSEMVLAMQSISKDKIVRSDTIQDSKEYIS